jgi:hypothetical protein
VSILPLQAKSRAKTQRCQGRKEEAFRPIAFPFANFAPLRLGALKSGVALTGLAATGKKEAWHLGDTPAPAFSHRERAQKRMRRFSLGPQRT